MSRYTGPKNKLSRREGFDLFGKGEKLKHLDVPPGGLKKRRFKKLSEYGLQLREKQKVKRLYGVSERQFVNYYKESRKSLINTGDKLVSVLERRLDNVIYRLSFSKTRSQARQLVSHRHVLVDGAITNIPSYLVKMGQVISLKSNLMENPNFKILLENENPIIPKWLERRGLAGKVLRSPQKEDVVEPISTETIVEFYSR